MIATVERNVPAVTFVDWLSPGEPADEAKLRAHFSDAWATATGSPRDIYDAITSAIPLVPDVTLDQVEAGSVRGWWVRPQSAPKDHAILFIHGGAYVGGSAKGYRGFASQIVSRTGVPALVIDYPLAPESRLPSAPDAALVAWDFLIEQGYSRIAIVGNSSGGGLALVTLQQLIAKGRDPAPIAGAVFSPWTDLALTGPSMNDPDVIDPLVRATYLRDCAAKYLGRFEATDPLASPLYGDVARLPPLFIQVGTDDHLLDDSRRFAAKAAKAGVSVELEVWEGMHHSFQLDVARLESSRIALDRAAGFLSRRFPR